MSQTGLAGMLQTNVAKSVLATDMAFAAKY
jgi:hypothetical protein